MITPNYNLLLLTLHNVFHKCRYFVLSQPGVHCFYYQCGVLSQLQLSGDSKELFPFREKENNFTIVYDYLLKIEQL